MAPLFWLTRSHSSWSVCTSKGLLSYRTLSTLGNLRLWRVAKSLLMMVRTSACTCKGQNRWFSCHCCYFESKKGVMKLVLHALASQLRLTWHIYFLLLIACMFACTCKGHRAVSLVTFATFAAQGGGVSWGLQSLASQQRLVHTAKFSLMIVRTHLLAAVSSKGRIKRCHICRGTPVYKAESCLMVACMLFCTVKVRELNQSSLAQQSLIQLIKFLRMIVCTSSCTHVPEVCWCRKQTRLVRLMMQLIRPVAPLTWRRPWATCH